MKVTFDFRFYVITILLILLSQSESTCQAIFEVGYAQRSIVPTTPAYIAGHSHDRLFNGVHDPIYVKAGVISNDRDEVVTLVTFDCIGMLHPQLSALREKIKEVLPVLPADRIVMSSTHTHSGPDVVGIWGKDFFSSGVDPVYLNKVVDLTVEVIIEAWKNKTACTARYIVEEHGHEWVFNISEPNELDRSLTVLQWIDADKNNVLTISNFACHPTFLDADFDNISSDYVGGYYGRLDSVHGGGNMFFQGAIGGWVQPEHEEKSYSQAFFRGREIADKIVANITDAPYLRSNEIRFSSSKFLIPLENQAFKMLSNAGVIHREFGDSVLTEIACFTLGNAVFATHPGETTPSLSLRTKELMATDGPKFILGLGMDALGYILKPYFFNESLNIPHSKYLCSVSVGIQTETFILKELKRIINELNNRD